MTRDERCLACRLLIAVALNLASLALSWWALVARSADGWWLNDRKPPMAWLLPALGIGGALCAAGLVNSRHALTAFAAFAALAIAIVGVIGTAGAASFPFIVPSARMLDASLTARDRVSGPMTLGLTLGTTLVFMPLIAPYTSRAHREMRGKLAVAHIRTNERNAY